MSWPVEEAGAKVVAVLALVERARRVQGTESKFLSTNEAFPQAITSFPNPAPAHSAGQGQSNEMCLSCTHGDTRRRGIKPRRPLRRRDLRDQLPAGKSDSSGLDVQGPGVGSLEYGTRTTT